MSSRAISAAFAVRPLKEKDEVRATTRSPCIRDSRLSVPLQAVREVLVRLVRAQVGERQDGDRALIGGGLRGAVTPVPNPRRAVQTRRGWQPAAGSRRASRGFPPAYLFIQERSSASGKPIRSSTKTSFSPQAHLEHLEQQLCDLQQHPRGDRVQNRRLDHLARLSSATKRSIRSHLSGMRAGCAPTRTVKHAAAALSPRPGLPRVRTPHDTGTRAS